MPAPEAMVPRLGFQALAVSLPLAEEQPYILTEMYSRTD